MKFSALILFVVLLAPGELSVRGQEKATPRPGGANERFKEHEFRASNQQVLRYSLFVPAPGSSAKLPLVLCLHGAGGNTAAANILASAEMQQKHPCVVMAPACDSS